MLDTNISMINAIDCVLPNMFISDLAKTITNNENEEGAIRWLLTLASECLRKKGKPYSPLEAFDFICYDLESIGKHWPMIHKMISIMEIEVDVAPQLVRFMAERLPALWNRERWKRHNDLTRTLILADRTYDLIGLFSIGLHPNGSKDPYALRRAANHWLMQVIFPVTLGLKTQE